MKSVKNTWKTILMCCGLLAGMSATTYAQSPYPNDLDVGSNYLPTELYENRAKKFIELFQVDISKSGTSLYTFEEKNIYERVSRKQLFDLQDSLADPHNGQSYAALRVIYGMKIDENSKEAKIVFIYLPVLIELNDSNAGTIDDIDTFKVLPGGYKAPDGEEFHYYYIDDNGALAYADDMTKVNELKQWAITYKSRIKINEREDGVFSNHDEDDAISETFSFKSLEKYFSNFDTLYVTCGSRELEIQGKRPYKHYVAFANSPFTAIHSSKTKASDLGTLCPPNCLMTRVIDGHESIYKIIGILAAIAAASFGIYRYFGSWRKKENRL